MADVVRDVIYSEVTGLVQQVLKIFGFISLKEAGQTHERAVQGGPRANLNGEVREQVPNLHGFSVEASVLRNKQATQVQKAGDNGVHQVAIIPSCLTLTWRVYEVFDRLSPRRQSCQYTRKGQPSDVGKMVSWSGYAEHIAGTMNPGADPQGTPSTLEWIANLIVPVQ